MSTSPKNQDALRADAKPRPPRQPVAGELLFEFYVERAKKFWRAELRDRGEWGVEAQLLEDLELRWAQMFRPVSDGDRTLPARDIAIRWAEETRDYIIRGGDPIEMSLLTDD